MEKSIINRYKINLNDETFEVKIWSNGDYSIGDSIYTPTIITNGNNTSIIKIDDKTYKVSIDENRLFINEDAVRFNYKPVFSNHKPQIVENMDVKTKIPGTITKVLVKESNVVKKDDPLLFLETMKMRIQICAPFRAIISKIAVKAGDRVDSNQALLSLSRK